MIASLLSVFVVLAAQNENSQRPIGPLQRFDPKLYDVSFEVLLNTPQVVVDATQRPEYDLVDAPIVMPVIDASQLVQVETSTIQARLWLGSREDSAANDRARLERNQIFQTSLAVIPIEQFKGKSLRWRLEFRTQVWSSRITDEAAAARLPWPSEFPKHAQDGLKPQAFIESTEQVFLDAVESVTQGRAREFMPYVVAKELVRYCLENIAVEGDGTWFGPLGELRGMKLQGALKTAESGRGSPHDLVCVCVAVLQAAGIPARPVVGIVENERGKKLFASWAEFYLDGAGWIPFDPFALQKRGVRKLDVKNPWHQFGTMKDLNDRVTLAYGFMPARSIQVPQNPAVWAWDPRPGGDPSTEQHINIGITSRGPGTPDPAEQRPRNR